MPDFNIYPKPRSEIMAAREIEVDDYWYLEQEKYNGQKRRSAIGYHSREELIETLIFSQPHTFTDWGIGDR